MTKSARSLWIDWIVYLTHMWDMERGNSQKIYCIHCLSVCDTVTRALVVLVDSTSQGGIK